MRDWYRRNKTKAKAYSRKYRLAHLSKYREIYRRLRALRMDSYKLFMRGLYCNYCGIGDYRVLDWAHTGESRKLGNISNLVAKLGDKRLYTEMNNCVLLCANCHRIFDWSKSNEC